MDSGKNENVKLKMNWVGRLDYTLPRKQTTDCPNPHYAFVVAEML